MHICGRFVSTITFESKNGTVCQEIAQQMTCSSLQKMCVLRNFLGFGSECGLPASPISMRDIHPNILSDSAKMRATKAGNVHPEHNSFESILSFEGLGAYCSITFLSLIAAIDWSLPREGPSCKSFQLRNEGSVRMQHGWKPIGPTMGFVATTGWFEWRWTSARGYRELFKDPLQQLDLMGRIPHHGQHVGMTNKKAIGCGPTFLF